MSTSLTPHHLSLVASRLPKDVAQAMQLHGVVLGGGFIRETIAGNLPHDIDLFGSDATKLRLIAEQFANGRDKGKGLTRLHCTENADSVFSLGRTPVQFIHRWTFDHPEAVLSSFDFTVCCAVVWRDTDGGWHSATHDSFYADLAGRRLVYTQPQRIEEAGGSLMRVIKFVKRGYTIGPTELGKVAARLAMAHEKLQHTSEVELGRVFSGLLLEVDPLSIVDGIEEVGAGEENQGL